MTPDALVSEQKCGKCGLPIERGETGLRHFGTYTAHSEGRCYSLMRDTIERLTRERDEARQSVLDTQAVAEQYIAERDAARVELAEAIKYRDEFGKQLLEAGEKLADARNTALDEAATVAYAEVPHDWPGDPESHTAGDVGFKIRALKTEA